MKEIKLPQTVFLANLDSLPFPVILTDISCNKQGQVLITVCNIDQPENQAQFLSTCNEAEFKKLFAPNEKWPPRIPCRFELNDAEIKETEHKVRELKECWQIILNSIKDEKDWERILDIFCDEEAEEAERVADLRQAIQEAIDTLTRRN